MLTLTPTSLFEPAGSTTHQPSSTKLLARGRRAVEAGRLHDALALNEKALAAARREGDQDQIELAICNRSSVAIAVGRHSEVLADLRPVLLANRRPEACFLAADSLSWAHELSKDFKKGLFYARSAFNYARRAENQEWLASSHNQIGNCLVGDSRFEEAASEYHHALAILADEPSVVRAGVIVNLGYCNMMQGDLANGFRLAFKGLRWYRRLGAKTYEAWPHQDLCYAYLEAERPLRARQHGLRALELATETGDRSALRNALFLLGETEKAAGDPAAARSFFERLQQEFYPESPQLLSVLSAVSMRQVVNLRA